MSTLERLKAVGGGGGGGGCLGEFFFQKDAKWCILLHFGYKIYSVKSLISPCCLKYVVIMKTSLLFSGVSDIFIQTLICWCLGIISSKCSASKLYFKYRFWLVWWKRIDQWKFLVQIKRGNNYRKGLNNLDFYSFIRRRNLPE